MNAVMVFANISAPELRARSVAEPVIHFVERNRVHLQRTSQQQEAIKFVQRLKNEFIEKCKYFALFAFFTGITDASTDLPIMKQHQVPENQRREYSRILKQAYRCAQEVEPKLLMYFYVLKDADMVRKLTAIVRILYIFARPAVLYSPSILQIYTTREQHALITNGIQKFILPLSTLSTLIAQVQQLNTQFSVAVGSSAP
jgi:hypothetical protein